MKEILFFLTFCGGLVLLLINDDILYIFRVKKRIEWWQIIFLSREIKEIAANRCLFSLRSCMSKGRMLYSHFYLKISHMRRHNRVYKILQEYKSKMNHWINLLVGLVVGNLFGWHQWKRSKDYLKNNMNMKNWSQWKNNSEKWIGKCQFSTKALMLKRLIWD